MKGGMKFPDTLYVILDESEPDDPCTVSYQAIEDIPDDAEGEAVAAYKLVKVSKFRITKELE